jgi:hypothetical protein
VAVSAFGPSQVAPDARRQFDIDLGQNFGVKQRRCVRRELSINISRIGHHSVGPGRVLARQQQSIDEPLSCDQRALGSFSSREEIHDQTGVVDHNGASSMKAKEFIGNFYETSVLFGTP